MDQTKERSLIELARIFAQEGTAYAIIGGIALQIHQREPRTTLDVDIAAIDSDALPRDALAASGFEHLGTYAHSENWRGPDGVPIQFTFDPEFHKAIASAEPVAIGEHTLRVVRTEDLLHAKLRAAADPAWRRSKRILDLADAQSLLEQDPQLERFLNAEESRLLSKLMLP